MYQYRKIFYQNYFESQAGRRLPVAELKSNVANEIDFFNIEIMPFIKHHKEAAILDIGCGFGSLVAACQQKGFIQAQGIDISPDMVKTASELGISNISQADLLPFLANHPHTFDIITGMDIIEHFGKDELVEVLTAVKNSLKPKGRAIFRTPNTDAPFFTIYSYGDFTHENYLNVSSAKQVMLNMGFSKAEVYPSLIKTNGFIKEMFRKVLWWWVCVFYKMQLFASGRSSKDVVFTPNLVIVADV